MGELAQMRICCCDLELRQSDQCHDDDIENIFDAFNRDLSFKGEK